MIRKTNKVFQRRYVKSIKIFLKKKITRNGDMARKEKKCMSVNATKIFLKIKNKE